MPRLAAKLSCLFTELPFRNRFGAAAGCGFRGVEHLFPCREAAEPDIRERLRNHDLRAVPFKSSRRPAHQRRAASTSPSSNPTRFAAARMSAHAPSESGNPRSLRSAMIRRSFSPGTRTSPPGRNGRALFQYST